MEEYTQLRLEYNRESNREFLKERLGCVCANCGSTLDVEYHHVVPLRVGGTNRLTNIVPLCYVCHKIVHDTKNIRMVCRSENYGRPKIQPPEGYEEILWEYINGEIGKKECQSKLGMREGAKLNDKWYYKEFLKSNNIVSHKNSIDLLNCKDRAIRNHTGALLATVVYDDGTVYEKYA